MASKIKKLVRSQFVHRGPISLYGIDWRVHWAGRRKARTGYRENFNIFGKDQ